MEIIKNFKNLIEIKKTLKGKAKLLSDFIISLMIIMTIAGIILLPTIGDFLNLLDNNEFLLEQTDEVLSLNLKKIEESYKSNINSEKYLEKFKKTYLDIQNLNKKMYLEKDDVYKINFIGNISRLDDRIIGFESKEVLRRKLISLNKIKVSLYELNSSNLFIEDDFISNTNKDLEKLKTMKFVDEKEVINLSFEIVIFILFIGQFLFLIIITYLLINIKKVDRIFIEAEKEIEDKL